MKREQFSYVLPDERIAQTPVEPRDHSRLLAFDRQTGQTKDHHFYDLPDLLRAGDVLIRNVTKVLPVRLFGAKTTGGKAEILLVKRLEQHGSHEIWTALSRPGLKENQVVEVGPITITCLEKDGFARKVRVTPGGEPLIAALNKHGELPTPPYIEKFAGDPNRYQTIYAQTAGSAAAPTAGLHFTPELIDRLQGAGVIIADVTLHVGLGTFLPVKEDDVAKHHMHSEWYSISPETAKVINRAQTEKRRIIAVGTTSMRALEAAGRELKFPMLPFTKIEQDTNIFITPPYKFKVCSGLITNFHLPESTLLMLVSAFTTEPQSRETFTTFGESNLGKAYSEAIEKEYRFFSFGDAMLIV
jgi:S-adenosylmethionine:tRNA ribosyltransferase-isomerase